MPFGTLELEWKKRIRPKITYILFRKVLPVHLLYFQAIYHHVHQTFSLKDHIYS